MTLAFAQLPENYVTWAQVVPAGGDTFEQYNIYRRLSTETAWTRIATALLITSISYSDYEVASGVQYDYAISATYLRSGGPIESDKSTAVTGKSVTFTGEFLHDVGLPSQYVQLLATGVQHDYGQEQAVALPWGSSQAVVYFGPAQPRHWTITSKAQGSSPVRDMTLWNALKALIDRQYSASSTFCYRPSYTGELAYVSITPMRPASGSVSGSVQTVLRRADTAPIYVASFDLQEIKHSIAV